MRSCPHCGSPYSAPVEFCGIDGARLSNTDSDPLIGREVDRFEVREHLGDGAMARVYRARHKVLDREYALKVLFGEIASNKVLAERFRREAQTISKIDHPNVVSVADFGTTPAGLTFLTMELVRGRTLRQCVREEGPFTPRRAARIARQLADGLAAAHVMGFVHRDLKPSNVMLIGEAGADLVKILDFGLARASDADEDGYLTKTGQFVGTPIYMAPEQIIGGDVSAKADLYALGVVLYELLEGRPPFRAKRLGEIRQMHLTAPVPPLRPSDGLEVLVSRLLEKSPAARPASAAEVVTTIDALALDIGLESLLGAATIEIPLGQDPPTAPQLVLPSFRAREEDETRRVALLPSLLGEDLLDDPEEVPTRQVTTNDLPSAPDAQPLMLRSASESEARLSSSVGGLELSTPAFSGAPDLADSVEPSMWRSPPRRWPVTLLIVAAGLFTGAAGLWAVRGSPSLFGGSPVVLPPPAAVAPPSSVPPLEGRAAPSVSDMRPSAAATPAAAEPSAPGVSPKEADDEPGAAEPSVSPEEAVDERRAAEPSVSLEEADDERRAAGPPDPTKAAAAEEASVDPAPRRNARRTVSDEARRVRARAAGLDRALRGRLERRRLERRELLATAEGNAAWERWRRARRGESLSELNAAHDRVAAAIDGIAVDLGLVQARLDRVSRALQELARTVPPAELRALEDRYLALASGLEPGLPVPVLERMLRETAALEREVTAPKKD